jgi:hypothetical protein
MANQKKLKTISAEVDTTINKTESTEVTKSTLKTKKVKNKNRISRHGYPKQSPTVCVEQKDGKIVKVLRGKAEAMVKNGAKYTKKSLWRNYKNKVEEVK